jgi:hypothetical protein
MMADRLAGKRVDPGRGTAGIGFLALGLPVVILSPPPEQLVTSHIEIDIARPTPLRACAAEKSIVVVGVPKQLLT